MTTFLITMLAINTIGLLVNIIGLGVFSYPRTVVYEVERDEEVFETLLKLGMAIWAFTLLISK